MKDLEKSHADSAALSCKSYKKDLKSHNDSAVRSCKSYLKDPENSTWNRNRESYMKDLEKSRADSAAQSRESYKKDLEKSRWNETALAILYKSKKSCSLIGLASDQT